MTCAVERRPDHPTSGPANALRMTNRVSGGLTRMLGLFRILAFLDANHFERVIASRSISAISG